MEGREEILPDQIQYLLHAAYKRGQGENSVELGDSDHILAVSAVKAVAAVLTPPDLIAVAADPVGRCIGGGIVDLGGGGFLYPLFGKEPLAVENAAV